MSYAPRVVGITRTLSRRRRARPSLRCVAPTPGPIVDRGRECRRFRGRARRYDPLNVTRPGREPRGSGRPWTSCVDPARRQLLERALAAGFAFTVGGCERRLTPVAAREHGAELAVLSAPEVATLERLGAVLVPGADAAGIAHFVDSQLAAAPAEFLGTLRYMDWPPPFADFYRAGLSALDGFAGRLAGRPFVELPETAAVEAVRTISTSSPAGWQGPPAPLFYFVVRSDAVDVCYGSIAGFRRLGIPYLAHITPPTVGR